MPSPSSPSSSSLTHVGVERALQLDALRLDDQLLTHFHERVTEAGSRNIDPHILSFALTLFHHVNTLSHNEQTPGLELQSLALKRLSVARRALLVLCDVVLPHVFWRAASVVDLLIKWRFLRVGDYPSLGRLVARATAVSIPGEFQARRAAFRVVDMQLAWQALAQLALYTLPLIKAMCRLAAKAVNKLTRERNITGTVASSVTGASVPVSRGRSSCVICESRLFMPYQIVPCSCLGCYVCLHQSDVNRCPACKVSITQFKRLQTAPG